MKKQLIVFNPVIEKLLGHLFSRLIDYCHSCGWYTDDSKRGVPIVRERYKDYLRATSEKPVIDSRCPAVVEMVKNEFPELIKHLAPIDSILITGAQLALKDFKEKYGEEPILSVVTPCEALITAYAHLGPIFTWKTFRDGRGLNLPEQILKESPVPLGYFKPLEVPVIGTTGEKNVRKLLSIANNSQFLFYKIEIIELLFCEGGCHRGDGL